jgi:hypothetical protein
MIPRALATIFDLENEWILRTETKKAYIPDDIMEPCPYLGLPTSRIISGERINLCICFSHYAVCLGYMHPGIIPNAPRP